MGLLWSGPSSSGSIVLPSGEWSVDNLRFGLRAALKAGDYPRLNVPWKHDRDLCNSARGSVSKVDAADVLHRDKVFPREMSQA